MKKYLYIFLFLIIFTLNINCVFAEENERIEPLFTMNSDIIDIVYELFFDGDVNISSYGTSMETKQALLSKCQTIIDAVSTTGATPIVKGGIINSNKSTEITKLYIIYPEIDIHYLDLSSLLTKAGHTPSSINSFIKNLLKYAINVKDLNLHSNEATAYGSLLNKSSICMGYANLFTVLAEEAGIKNVKIRGYVDSSLHVINVVFINGEYKVIDITFNDTSNSNKFLLISMEEYCKLTKFEPLIDYIEMMNLKYGE